MNGKLSDRFFHKGQEFLDVQYPIICGAMTWISDPKLVSTVCNAGGFACLAGGNTPTEILRSQIEETRKLTDKPFGVNIITIAPLYNEHLELAREMKLPFIVFAGSFPHQSEIKKVKEIGAKVVCFASTLSIANRMRNYGADAIILEGMEAGGHVGRVSLTVLLQQVLFEVKDIPVFVAGGIATGKIAAHLFLMGASGIQMGTRFAVAKESSAHEKFKEAFFKANARQAVSTPQFDSRLPVVAVRALKNKGMIEFGKMQLKLVRQLEEGIITRQEAQIRVETYWMGALRNAVTNGDINKGSLMAGQSVGLVEKSESIQEIFDELLGDIEDELQAVKKSILE